MSVAYEPRSFHDDSPYAPVGENDHDHDHLPDHVNDHLGLNKYINTEANVDDMADLAAATYDERDAVVSPFNTSDDVVVGAVESPGPLDLVGPPNVDPTNVPVRDSSNDLLAGDDVGHDHDHDHAHANTPSGTRSKPIAKPNRAVTKNDDGLYECKWPDCKEEVKAFQRKCEWSKHMDKHERPYVCSHKECEKVQGFTYSGGLLRHEREVHGKHGGPKKALNCPHASCKRNKGKGFSRLENLQEHLRRVHRDASEGATVQPPSTPGGGGGGDDSASDVASAAFARVMGGGMVTSPPGEDHHHHHHHHVLTETTRGNKRRRGGEDEDVDGARARETSALREENERLKRDNEDLRRQLAEQTRVASEMRSQLQSMQAAINQTLAVPQPPVL